MEKVFQVGEYVYLRLRIYLQKSVHYRKFEKLSRRFFSPFKIIERIGNVAYRLELPLDSRIHPVFDVSLLRPCFGDPTTSVLPLLTTDIEGLPQLHPEEILDHRIAFKNGIEKSQVLVKWKNRDISESLWEFTEDIQDLIDLEDKVIVN